MTKKLNYRINNISEDLFEKFKNELIKEFKIDISKLENSSTAKIKGKNIPFRYKRTELVNDSLDIELTLELPALVSVIFNKSMVKSEFEKKIKKYNWSGELLEI